MSDTTRRRRSLPGIAAAILISVVTTIAAGAGTVGAADEPLTVDISVELDYLGKPPSPGAKTFAVTGVDATAGTWELTEDDELDNPGGWCGSVMVDVDPDRGLITVATEDDCNFHTARVRITSDRIADVRLVRENLWGAGIDEITGDPAGRPMDPVVITHAGDSFDLSWRTDVIDPGDDGPDFDPGSYLLEDGVATFAFTPVTDDGSGDGDDGDDGGGAPTTTSTTVAPGGMASTPTVADGGDAPPTAAPSADPVTGRPTYTG